MSVNISWLKFTLRPEMKNIHSINILRVCLLGRDIFWRSTLLLTAPFRADLMVEKDVAEIELCKYLGINSSKLRFYGQICWYELCTWFRKIVQSWKFWLITLRCNYISLKKYGDPNVQVLEKKPHGGLIWTMLAGQG